MFYRMHSGYARAIVDGRDGRSDDALAAFATGEVEASLCPLYRHLYLRLVGEAALADGWGRPEDWLSEAEAWFRAAVHHRVAGACRGLLQRAGVRVGRSGAEAESAVPETLRRAGVTARETEVLALIRDHLTNREIAARLFLSPRTVEKHVASLLTKLGMASRSDLSRMTDADG